MVQISAVYVPALSPHLALSPLANTGVCLCLCARVLHRKPEGGADFTGTMRAG